MKAIICAICNEIRALRPKGSMTCACGHVTAWWVDPNRGIAKVKAKYRDEVRILGMHNSFLQFAFDVGSVGNPSYVHEKWREIHDLVTSELSEGYLFSKVRRNCPFVIIRVGESNDVTWAADDEVPPEKVVGRDSISRNVLVGFSDCGRPVRLPRGAEPGASDEADGRGIRIDVR